MSGEDLPADAEATSFTTRLRAGGKAERVHIRRPKYLLCSLDHARVIIPSTYCPHACSGSREFLLSFCATFTSPPIICKGSSALFTSV